MNATCHPDLNALARGLCSACYQREWKKGEIFNRPKRVRPQPTPEQKRRYHLLRTYNMTLEDFDSLLNSQEGLCAMCGEGFGEEIPSVDHDHSCCPSSRSCGKCVRGLLHRRCNSLLRWAGDNPELLLKSLKYLTKRPDDQSVISSGHPPVANGVVLVDFDQTLYPFGDLFGAKPPLEGAVDAVNAIKNAGFTIIIFTSRMSQAWWSSEGWDHDEARQRQVEYINYVLNRDGIPFDGITGEKIPAVAMIDDKAIEYDGTNWDAIKERVLGL